MSAEKPHISSYPSSHSHSHSQNTKSSSSLQSIFHKNRKLWKRTRKSEPPSLPTSQLNLLDRSETPMDFNANTRINPIFCSDKMASFSMNHTTSSENYGENGLRSLIIDERSSSGYSNVLKDHTFEGNVDRMNSNYIMGASPSSSIYSSISSNHNNGIKFDYDHEGRHTENPNLKSDEDSWVQIQAELLSAECKLLRAEQELVLRKWRQGCDDENTDKPTNYTDRTDDGSEEKGERAGNHSNQSNQKQKKKKKKKKKQSSNSVESNCDNMKQSSPDFAHEALRRLNSNHNRNHNNNNNNATDFFASYNPCIVRPIDMLDDPTQALQERLQNLLIVNASSSSSSSPASSPSPSPTPSPARQYVNTNEQHSRSVDSICKNCGLNSPQGSMAAIIRDNAGKQSIMREQDQRQQDHEAFAVNPEPEMYCKATIRRIVEQMRVESEHWSQMQDVLRSLQEEMSTLSREREHWETRALRAEAELLSLHETAHEMYSRAKNAEQECAALRTERRFLMLKLQNLKQHATTKAARHIAMEMRSDNGMGKKVSNPCHGTSDTLVFPREVTPMPLPKESYDVDEIKKNLCGPGVLDEKPRFNNFASYSVGSLEELHSARQCESFVHSRNESSRSSVDLGHHGGQKINLLSKSNIKKALDFNVNGVPPSNEGVVGHTTLAAKKSSRSNYYRLGHTYQRLFSKGSGGTGSKVDGYPCKNRSSSDSRVMRPKKDYKPRSHDDIDIDIDVMPDMHFIRTQKVKNGVEYRGTSSFGNVERKKARLINVSDKENRPGSLISSSSSYTTCQYEGKDGFVAGCVRADDDKYQDYFVSLKSIKSPNIPTAPTSTPSKFPFSEVANNIPTSSIFKI